MDQEPASGSSADDVLAQFMASAAAIRAKMIAALDQALAEHEELLQRFHQTVRLPTLYGTAASSSKMQTERPLQATMKRRPFGDPNSGRRTSRMIVLTLLGSASGPLDWQIVRDEIATEGWSKAASDKVRETMLKKGTIEAKGGLYTLTQSGREQYESFRSAEGQPS